MAGVGGRVVGNRACLEKEGPNLPPPPVLSDQIGDVRFPNNRLRGRSRVAWWWWWYGRWASWGEGGSGGTPAVEYCRRHGRALPCPVEWGL